MTARALPPARALAAWVGAFVDELARAGVRHVCVAPGSRSAPLALAFAEREAARGDVRLWMHLDERSAAYFALGLARWSGRPVALLCTSGTAAANFLPAVAEARHARVPLLVLTADRPPELRDVGAAQTIDQTRLFGAHAKWFVEAALPEATPELLRYARTLAGRAAAAAVAAPAGPVHLNVPFREPLVPEPGPAPEGLDAGGLLAWHGRPGGEPWVRVAGAPRTPSADDVAHAVALLGGARRPVVVCGPQPDPALAAPLARLTARLGAPLLADPLSQLRWGPHDRSTVIDAYDAFLRDDGVAGRLAPDVVVRVGAAPTSKAVLQWLLRHPAARLVVVDEAGWPEPTLTAAAVVHAEPVAWCETVLARLDADGVAGTDAGADAGGPPPDSIMPPPERHRVTDPPPGASDGCSADPAAGGPPPTNKVAPHGPASATDSVPGGAPSPGADPAWLDVWRTVDAAARGALHAHADALAEPFEGGTLRDVAAALPDGATLWVSSSMPVRDLDAFAPGDGRRLRVLANRGANGIDGVVSSALGAAAAAREAGVGPLVLVIGDLAFYHDMNGLLAAKLHALDATVVLVNNDGGGIFSFLPQAARPHHFERLFGTPHGLDFRPVAEMYGAAYAHADAPAALHGALATALARPGLDVVEVRTDRTRNVALHRGAWLAVTAALASVPFDASPGLSAPVVPGAGEPVRGGPLVPDDVGRAREAAGDAGATRHGTVVPEGEA